MYMPYKIHQVKGGFKVVDPTTRHVFSKKPLTRVQSQKQRIAIALSEHKKTGKPVGVFFA